MKWSVIRLARTVPKETKIVFSGNSPREDIVERLVEEITTRMRMDEQEEIAQRLLLHEMIDGPPEIIEEFGELQAMSGRDLLDSTKEQNWRMAQDKYRRKFGRAHDKGGGDEEEKG